MSVIINYLLSDTYLLCTVLPRPLDADDSSESSSDEESDESHGKRFQAVTCTGRQLGSDVFVFGPTLHLSVDGDVIPEEQQVYGQKALFARAKLDYSSRKLCLHEYRRIHIICP